MTIESRPPSAKSAKTLAALTRAVQNALDRKRRLGQYAVVWRDGAPAPLDDAAEDRDVFFESLKDDPLTNVESGTGNNQNQQSGVAFRQGNYPSDK